MESLHHHPLGCEHVEHLAPRCLGHRGVWWAEIETHGRIAHGSMPFLGDSAIRHMAAVLAEFERTLYPALAEKRTAMPVVPPQARQSTMNVNSIVGQAIATIPLLVLAVDALLDRPNWTRAALVALAVAFCVLASFMPVVISALLLVPFLWMGHALVREEGDPGFLPRAAGSGVRLAAGVLLGLALAAFLLVPVRLAGRQDPHFSAWYRNLGLQHYDADVTLTSARIIK